MAAHFIVQASVAIWGVGAPGDQGWTFVFAVFVTNEVGTPVEGLKIDNFSVWELKVPTELSPGLLWELNSSGFPGSQGWPGIYRLQTGIVGSWGAPPPQQFLCAIRVTQAGGRGDLTLRQGMTTVPITYLGNWA
jgi:hypothetical protein